MYYNKNEANFFKQAGYTFAPTPKLQPRDQAGRTTQYNQRQRDTRPPLWPCEFSHALTFDMN